MANKKAFFNPLWLIHEHFPEYASWIAKVENNKTQAYCKVCKKTLNLSNMGKQALSSHSSGTFHQKTLQATQQLSIESFFRKKVQESTTSNPSTSNSSMSETLTSNSSGQIPCKNESNQMSTAKPNLESYVLKEDVSRAEIIWSLQLVMTKMSFNSCQNINKIFQLMFPQNPVAIQFSLGGGGGTKLHT